MEQSQENLEDEAIFPSQASLRDLLSNELFEDGHYRDGEWFFFG